MYFTKRRLIDNLENDFNSRMVCKTLQLPTIVSLKIFFFFLINSEDSLLL